MATAVIPAVGVGVDVPILADLGAEPAVSVVVDRCVVVESPPHGEMVARMTRVGKRGRPVRLGLQQREGVHS